MSRLLSRLLPACVALVFLAPSTVFPQPQPGDEDQSQGYDEPADTPPAHISYTDGTVVVEHEASAEQVEPNTPLLPGDRVRTESGRAEVLFGDGSLIHLDEHTTIDLLSDRLLRLLAGRVVVVAGTGLAGHLQIDAAPASVRMLSAGEYRVSVLARGASNDLELAVIRGSAELIGDGSSMVLRAGQRALAAVGAPVGGPWPFNSAQFDAFDAWSQARLDARRGPTSYQYLPPEVHSYAGTFDSYGAWSYLPTYGYVWYPRVDHGWRPYYHGRWKHYRRFGWTWIGGPRWAWPTHHYGRWGISVTGSWFWIPGRHWRSAWVHWGIAPGYVSWCPLGFDNRPVLAFWSHRTRRIHDPWRAWTVVHRTRFGDRRYVRGYALDGRRLVSTAGTNFVTQAAAPGIRGTRSGRLDAGVAVPRESPRRRASVDAATRAIPHRSGRVSAFGSTAPGTGSSSQVAPGARARTLPRADGSTEVRTPARRGGGSIAGSSTARPSGRTGYAVPRGSTRPPGWRPEDVPVHRGRPPQAAPAPEPLAPAASGADDRSSSDPGPSPRYRSAPSRIGSSGEGRAVPRGGDRPSYTPPPSRGGDRGSDSPGRGSYGVPAQRSAPSSPPPSRAGDSGGRERRAPEGSGSGGRAVPRGSSGDSGGRGGVRSRR